MSLSEVAQIYEYLVRIDQLLSGMTVKTETINKNIGMSTSGGDSSLRRELHVINSYLVAAERWSGSDTLSNMINKVQEMQAMMWRLYILINAVNAAMAAGTPLGWLYVGTTAIGFVISAQNLVQ